VLQLIEFGAHGVPRRVVLVGQAPPFEMELFWGEFGGGKLMGWSLFNDGESVGTGGAESGIIQRDEEHELGARITLERGGSIAPWSITCGIYGWMFHTRFFSAEDESNREFDLMKAGLAEILAIIPTVAESTDEKMSAVSTAIEAFVKRFD
jgi:hypothetical protein